MLSDVLIISEMLINDIFRLRLQMSVAKGILMWAICAGSITSLACAVSNIIIIIIQKSISMLKRFIKANGFQMIAVFHFCLIVSLRSIKSFKRSNGNNWNEFITTKVIQQTICMHLNFRPMEIRGLKDIVVRRFVSLCHFNGHLSQGRHGHEKWMDKLNHWCQFCQKVIEFIPSVTQLEILQFKQIIDDIEIRWEHTISKNQRYPK